jgi:molybdenum cofactor biosynthesis protein B
LAHGEPARQVALALVTVSDTRTEADDESGSLARRLCEAAGHRVVRARIVPDEPARIRSEVRALVAERECEAILLTGGTGVAPRDRTPEALADMWDTSLPGFGELFRMLSFESVGARAMLSRASAGVVGGKPIFALPGSPRAVELALDRLILPELGHLLAELRR